MEVIFKKGEYIDGKAIADKLGLEFGHDEDIDETAEFGEPIELDIIFEGASENE